MSPLIAEPRTASRAPGLRRAHPRRRAPPRSARGSRSKSRPSPRRGSGQLVGPGVVVETGASAQLLTGAVAHGRGGLPGMAGPGQGHGQRLDVLTPRWQRRRGAGGSGADRRRNRAATATKAAISSPISAHFQRTGSAGHAVAFAVAVHGLFERDRAPGGAGERQPERGVVGAGEHWFSSGEESANSDTVPAPRCATDSSHACGASRQRQRRPGVRPRPIAGGQQRADARGLGRRDHGQRHRGPLGGPGGRVGHQHGQPRGRNPGRRPPGRRPGARTRRSAVTSAVSMRAGSSTIDGGGGIESGVRRGRLHMGDGMAGPRQQLGVGRESLRRGRIRGS